MEPLPTDVNILMHEIVDFARRLMGQGIELDAHGDPNLWQAYVDSSQLENALLNLCINARDAMPDGGRITLNTTNQHIDQSAAQSEGLAQGQYLCIYVKDTGSGIPPETLAHIFEPFFTTKPVGQGTGLGLSMVYGFAKQSGGQVRVWSSVGEGTTVCIYLPRYLEEISEAPGKSS